VRGHGVCGMTTATVVRPKRRIFPGSYDQVRQVRLFVTRVLEGCPVADEAVLLASELATNAIAHTASGRSGKFVVNVYRDDTRLMVTVRDDGSDQAPAVRPGGEIAESGYGLGLVELMAHGWGHCGGSQCRVVWFILEWKQGC
jgi:serine/threonine-protein kinase RsbW